MSENKEREAQRRRNQKVIRIGKDNHGLLNDAFVMVELRRTF